MNTVMKKTVLSVSVALSLSAVNAQAALVSDVLGPYNFFTDSANFTLLGPAGGTQPPGYSTNNVSLAWDDNAYNASSDYTGPGGAENVTASSTTPWFGIGWSMHDVQMFVPGSYSFDTALGGGNLESGILNVTVNPSQLGMHMLWDWNGNLNIDLFMVFGWNDVFGSGIGRSVSGTTPSGTFNCDAGIITNCLYDGPGYGSAGQPAGRTMWTLVSVDGNGDGIMGIPMMAGGPIEGYSWNLNANLNYVADPIPVPAAAWLFGSGLLGLFGLMRRRRGVRHN